MNRALTKKVVLSLLMLTMLLALLQGFSFAKSENIQMIKKSENEYMIYVSDLLDKEFKFAFSNEENVADKSTLAFKDAALDSTANGNHIAYVDSDLYTQYFKNKDNTYLWVKLNSEYKLSGEKVELKDALTEEEIQALNSVTKTIIVTVGEKQLPTETEDGVEISHKIDTLNIQDKTGNYSYKIVKASEGTDAAKLVKLAQQLNTVQDEDMFKKLSVYGEFKAMYDNLKPQVNDTKWEKVEDYIVEQPQNSKTGEQYLVWLKQETDNGAIIDLQIMTCKDEYIPEYENQEIVIKETSLLPKTGDNIILFVVAGIILILIIAVVVLKFKNKRETK